ncbi:MAG: hypothetical protein GW911_34250 [Armatimonadetes bacterium]|nr:hypothetical protein [Armatimonadota bacterium]NCP34110.1 hypothetical protein [Armatimonadota bacterium]NDK17117.1 hypothetical protein [Armatimonadota bacterium]
MSHDWFLRTPGNPTPRPMGSLVADPVFREIRPPSTWVFRNGVLRFNPQLSRGGEDLEWFLRNRDSLHMVHLPKPLIVYHKHAGQMTEARDTLAPAQQVMASPGQFIPSAGGPRRPYGAVTQ